MITGSVLTRPPASEWQQRGSPRTRYARVGDASVAYQVVGHGGADLVFVPGFVSNVDLQWELEPMASFFGRLAQFARLIVFDKRGTGLSDRLGVAEVPPLEERMEDIRAVMDAAGSERATLFGISEGGPLALLFAATYPERVERLVLCNSYAGPFRDDIAELAASARDHWGSGGVFGALAPSWRDLASLRLLSRYERHCATPDAAAHLLALSDRIDVRPILGSITVPTLVLHRRDDDIVPLAAATELAAGIPGAELIVLEGRDHLVYVDPGAVLDAVETFTTGTVTAPPAVRVLTTLLFVDVVGSTALAERLGDGAWTEALADFYRMARDHLARFRGDEVVTTGDGLLATFDAPARAVQFGLALSATARRAGLSLRVGVHTSEVERVGADIAGLGVHVGARVASAARSGEVWVTRTVRDLVAGAGLRLDPRGVHELKGVSDPWELFAAVG